MKKARDFPEFFDNSFANAMMVHAEKIGKVKKTHEKVLLLFFIAIIFKLCYYFRGNVNANAVTGLAEILLKEAMDMIEQYTSEINELVAACHRVAELGYVASSGGNLSMRVDDNLILITPTKTFKRLVTAKDICAVDLDGNTIYAPEGKKPTGETPFHAMIMNNRKDVVSVVHAHPPILTGFAIADTDILEKMILPEPAIEVGPAVRVKYATPISDELSDEFMRVIHKSNFFLMENHGATICNTHSALEAVEQMQMMECMARSVLCAAQLGGIKVLPDAAAQGLCEVLNKRNLAIPGAPGEYSSLTELYGIDII